MKQMPYEMHPNIKIECDKLLIYTEGNSYKFYGARKHLNGMVEVRYGRIGNYGATIIYTENEADRKISEKLLKGYDYIDGKTSYTPPDPIEKVADYNILAKIKILLDRLRSEGTNPAKQMFVKGIYDKYNDTGEISGEDMLVMNDYWKNLK